MKSAAQYATLSKNAYGNQRSAPDHREVQQWHQLSKENTSRKITRVNILITKDVGLDEQAILVSERVRILWLDNNLCCKVWVQVCHAVALASGV